MSGNNLSKAAAGKNKAIQYGRAFPDFHIAQASDEFYALYIEIKAEGVKLFKKDGVTFISEHVQEQNDMLVSLRLRNFKAEFGIGFDACRILIDDYLKNLY